MCVCVGGVWAANTESASVLFVWRVNNVSVDAHDVNVSTSASLYLWTVTKRSAPAYTGTHVGYMYWCTCVYCMAVFFARVLTDWTSGCQSIVYILLRECVAISKIQTIEKNAGRLTLLLNLFYGCLRKPSAMQLAVGPSDQRHGRNPRQQVSQPDWGTDIKDSELNTASYKETGKPDVHLASLLIPETDWQSSRQLL